MDVGVSVAGVALGATVLEKRCTLSRVEGGVDSAFSLEPHELAALVQESELAWQALAQVCYGPTEAKKASLVFRRSIYVAADIADGEIFTTENLRIVRPGQGAPPLSARAAVGSARSLRLSTRHTPQPGSAALKLAIDQHFPALQALAELKACQYLSWPGCVQPCL